MPIKYDEIPQNIVDAYNLKPLVHDGHIYMEIRKGMPGLKQAGRLANERLVNHLAKYGYAPVAQTPSLWRHHTRPVAFTLVVNDFGIKYEGKQHFDHLISARRHRRQNRYKIPRPHNQMGLQKRSLRNIHARVRRNRTA